MTRFRDILFCTERGGPDRAAFELALGLAGRNGGRLTVLTVVDELPRDLLRLAAAMPSGALQDLAVREARELLERAIAAAPADGVPVVADVACGKPSIEIVRAVLRRRHDLVVIAGSARKGLKGRIFGSTGMRLMRKCPCPVWVVNAPPNTRFKRVLAAVDPDPADPVRDGLDARILGLAASLAELYGGELHVVHAWQPIADALLHTWGTGSPDGEAGARAATVGPDHQRLLDELLDRCGIAPAACRRHLVEGDPAALIPEVAATEGIDLIVMGTVARTGLQGYLIGNTAETVLRHVTCSVMAVKPDGFVSPVGPRTSAV